MTEKNTPASVPDAGSSFHVEANGIRFHCRIDGRKDAPWLVFSNSLATNLSLWDGQIATFENSFRILRYDQRGHGGTEVPSEPCSFEQLVDDVVALFDALAIPRATFVGVSMGAVTALRLAARHAERLDRMVACDGQWVSPAGARELWEERFAVVRKQGMEALVEPTARRWFRPEFIAGNPPVLAKVRRMIATTPAGGVHCLRARSPTIRLPSVPAADRRPHAAACRSGRWHNAGGHAGDAPGDARVEIRGDTECRPSPEPGESRGL